MNQINELYQQLAVLESQKQSIDSQILQIKKQIERLSPFSKQEKIQLFKSLFITREDIYSLYWTSKDGTKKGYSPKKYTFRGKDYIPINDTVIQQHLEGKIRLGSYAVINQTMAKFLVIDLDKASFIEDARAIVNVSLEVKLKSLIELSKSGNGIHIWFFFETLVLASSARKIYKEEFIMYTIKLDVNDTIYDKVMFFLKSMPIKNMVIEKTDDVKSKKQDDIVSFFQSSPLTGEVSLERDSEKYTNRIAF